MAEDDDLPLELAPGRDAGEANDVSERICAIHKTWTPGVVLELGDLSWNPNLIEANKKWVLHVHVSDGMPRHIGRRLRAAAEAGYQVHVALPLAALYDSELLALLAEVDAYTYVIMDGIVEHQRRHFLAAIADLDVAVDPETRIVIGNATWTRLGAGTRNDRGRRLEALLAFLLSQIADFRIFSRNYRTATQEIDVVVQVTSYSGRCWFALGVPFILVESKNTVDKAGQPVVSLLVRKLQTKRGTARIGLLFSVAGFTSDAVHEELRLSETEFTVAMFDDTAIIALIKARDLDGQLENHLTRAMLR